MIVSAFAAFLALMTGAENILLSLPVSARTSALLRNSAGSVSNMLPLRRRRVRSSTVGEAMKPTQAALTAALRHQRYRRDIGRDRHSGAAASAPSDPAPFGPVINLMMFTQQISFGGVTGQVQVLTTGPTSELAINVYPGSIGSLPRIDFEGNSTAYSHDKLGAHHRWFIAFLDTFAAADSSTAIADLGLFLPGERTGFVPASGAADCPPSSIPKRWRCEQTNGR